MPETIVTERHEQIVRITLNLAQHYGYLTIEAVRDLTAAITEAANSDCSAVHLRTEGNDFCRGRAAGKREVERPTALQIRQNVAEPILGLYDAIFAANVPVVAAAQGRAFALGCALAASCDITIASEDARFKLPEMEHYLPPTLAISAMLGHMPRKALTYLVYTMAEIDAETALRLGLVSAVVPSAELAAATDSVLRTLSARSRPALAAVKQYIRSAPTMDSQGAADFAANLLSCVLSSNG